AARRARRASWADLPPARAWPPPEAPPPRPSTRPSSSAAAIFPSWFLSGPSDPGRLVVGAVERQKHRTLVRQRFDVHGTMPEAMQVLQGVARLLLIERNPLEPMLEIELAAVRIVRLRDVDDGLPHVRELEE